ncbi:MAG: asparagine synthetase B [Actinobacteria bacterium]|nr:asparagine synthetase B [Actinomycetota bacterium]
MAGLVGLFTSDTLERERGERLLKAMAGDISYTGEEPVDLWVEEQAAVSRVHHGILNPQPQPLRNEDGSILVFMDGEVFDYQSGKQRLSRQGHRFRYPDNDAEYVLHLYEQEGLEAFRELNGSFLVALYHVDSGKLVLATDRVNSRPVYYHWNGRDLVFGSQVRPLLRFPGLSREIDLQAVCEFFTFRKILGYRTFYRSVSSLPAASVLCLEHGQPRVSRYWNWERKDEFRTKRHYIHAFAEAMKKAVERRTGGGHRLGILLSGGLDSRTVLYAAGRGKIATAFTIADHPNRELKVARRLAAGYGCRHVILWRDLDHYLRMVPGAVAIGDGMYSCNHAHNLGYFETMREHADILLHGVAFGWLFKAYLVPLKQRTLLGHSVTIPVADIHEDVSPDEMIWNILGYSMIEISRNIFNMSAREVTELMLASVESQYNNPIAPEIIREARKTPAYLSGILDARQFGDHFHIIHNRAHMDERTVSFDNDLVDLALSVPTGLMVGNRLIKGILPRISWRTAIATNANTGLPAATPPRLESLLLALEPTARKHLFKPVPAPHPAFSTGSWPNYPELIRHNRKLSDLMLATIEDEECLDPRLFNLDRIRAVFHEHMEGKADYSEILFLLLTFGRWHKEYGSK